MRNFPKNLRPAPLPFPEQIFLAIALWKSPAWYWYNNHKIPITQEGIAVKWFHDMSEQEKQSFKKVIAVCEAGAAFILLIPAVFSLLG